MTLSAAIEAELPFLRAEAEARMTSRCIVHRATGATVQDEDTGLAVPQWASVYTDLPFRLGGTSTGDGGSHRVTVGGVEFGQATAVGHLPADTTDLADGDLIEVVAGEWSGTAWRIVEAVKGDQKTARRVPIEQVDRPAEWGA